MIIINVDNLSLSFGTKKILENVAFSLNEGDHLGINDSIKAVCFPAASASAANIRTRAFILHAPTGATRR